MSMNPMDLAASGRRRVPGWMVCLFLLLLLMSTGAQSAEHPFFAMNTIARGGPEEVVPLLKELGCGLQEDPRKVLERTMAAWRRMTRSTGR